MMTRGRAGERSDSRPQPFAPWGRPPVPDREIDRCPIAVDIESDVLRRRACTALAPNRDDRRPSAATRGAGTILHDDRARS